MTGSGTQIDPYQITTWAELASICNSSSYYKLMNDLDSLSDGYSTYAADTSNSNYGWIPIVGFSGFFDGDFHKISDLNINLNPSVSASGLFGDTNGSISNIDIYGCDISGYYLSGAICGALTEGGTIDKCSSSGNISSTYLTDHRSFAGGIVGINSGTITNSYSDCTCNGDICVGGLSGATDGSISNSYSTGSCICTGDFCGGLAGYNIGSIINCYSVGYIDSVGSNIGGLIGYSEVSATITDSYWNTQTSGMDTSSGGTGKTTIQMMDIDTFSTWDIVLISVYVDQLWGIDDGNDYPKLGFTLTSTYVFLVDNCSHTHTCENIVLSELIQLSVSNSIHVHKSSIVILKHYGTYILDSRELSDFGITGVHYSDSNIPFEGCYNLPERTGDTYHDWGDENGVESFTEDSDIILAGRDIKFSGLMVGSNMVGNLKLLYDYIDSFKTLVTLDTQYGIFNVFIKDLKTEKLNTGTKITITFREPSISITGTLPDTGESKYTIDSIPFLSFGLYLSNFKELQDIPEMKDQYFTKYLQEGYQITKRNHSTLEINGFIIGNSLSDFNSKVQSLYLIFSSSGERTIKLNNIISVECFAVDGFETSNIYVTSTVVIANFNISLIVTSQTIL